MAPQKGAIIKHNYCIPTQKPESQHVTIAPEKQLTRDLPAWFS